MRGIHAAADTHALADINRRLIMAERDEQARTVIRALERATKTLQGGVS